MPLLHRRQFLAVCGASTLAGLGATALAQDRALAAPAIPATDLIQPAQLVGDLHDKQTKEWIYQVGFEKPYDEAHVPGAGYAGPANTAAGLQILRDRLRTTAHDHPIVLYCGCCPWSRCPNIRAAYQAVTGMGFTSVKALYIADNFGADWVHKGYPVTKPS